MSSSVTERGANGESIAVRDQAVRKRFLTATILLTISLLGATLLSATARFFWLGDLAVHFPVQYAGLAIIAFLVFVGVRHPAWAALAFGLAVVNGMSASQILTPSPASGTAHCPGAPAQVRVASINVLYTSHDYQGVQDLIRKENPDAVVLMEMTPRWRAAMEKFQQQYPYRYQTTGVEHRGVDVWSRLPVKHFAQLPIEARQEPAIEATLMVQNRPLRLFAVHTSWPMAPGSAYRRNQQLELLAQQAQAVKDMPLLVVGDFNVSPFSPHLKRMVAESGLRSAAEGYGWQPTWPSFLLPAGIQIDHAFVSPSLTVKGFRRGSRDGSDHLPIIVDVAL